MTLENTPLDRAFAVLDALDQPGAGSNRISAAIQSLSGFTLTGASDAVRNSIESLAQKYNAIVRRYPTGSSVTPPELNHEDSRELTNCLRSAAEMIRDAETERILTRLRQHDRSLPEAEIIEARRHQSWFSPHLMRECYEQISRLRNLDNAGDPLPDDRHSSIPFFSLFLFSEWHVADSVPVILEGLRLPGEAPFDLLGDAVHEQVPRYLAQFLSDDLDQIDAMVRDLHTNLYVRWSSANSYKYVVRDQKISVEAAVARLDRLFHETKIADNDGRPGRGHCYELSAGILDAICSIGGSSSSTVSADHQNWNFVDESIIRREDFDEPSGSADTCETTEGLRSLPPTRIEDCLAELRPWGAFQPVPEPMQRSSEPRPRERPRIPVPRPTVQPLAPAVQKPSRRAARVPRNAPCPCGSGKKYKQCCLRKVT